MKLMKLAGIDTGIFKAHSVRGAATTAVANAFVPLEEILNMADWSNASRFRFFWRDSGIIVYSCCVVVAL